MFVIKICHSYEQFYITVTKKKLSYEMHQYDKQCLLLLQNFFISVISSGSPLNVLHFSSIKPYLGHHICIRGNPTKLHGHAQCMHSHNISAGLAS